MFWLFWKHFFDDNRQNNPATAYSQQSVPISPLLASFSREVFCLIDQDLNLIRISDNWKNLVGKTPSCSFADYVSDSDLSLVANYLNKENNKLPPLDLKIIHKNGDKICCELQFAESSSDQNGNKLYHCLIRDTEKRNIEKEELQRAKLDADLALKTRSEFLANMSHELRTPLNAIIGFSQVMQSGIYGEIGHQKYDEYIENIQAGGLTLLSKINDLIDIADIDSGSMELQESQVDLVEVIQRAIEFHSHRAFAEHIILRDELPLKAIAVKIDRIRILQVLTNLISNAIRHNKKGGSVDIYCENRKDGGLNIVIEDTGNGIASKNLQNIIAAFGQENSFFARTRNCVGLGLALSKEIVKLHQGRIDIESKLGKGTIVRVMLPKERLLNKSAPTTKLIEYNYAG